jgi:DNA-binding MarR family transcriptional regulator
MGNDAAGAGASDQAQRLVDALALSAFATVAVMSKVGAEHDLSLTQMRVFGILRDRRLRMAELAAHLGLEKSTMSGLVDRAEKRGLLARAPSLDDGRAVEVFLTPAGEELAAYGAARIRDELSPMTSKLNPADQQLLRTLLERTLDPGASGLDGDN